MLITGVAVVVALVLGATLWALQRNPRGLRDVPVELHNVDRVSRAEGLDRLPRDYSKIASKPPEATPAPPVLGEPLPGDFGGPLLRAEREAAANPTSPRWLSVRTPKSKQRAPNALHFGVRPKMPRRRRSSFVRAIATGRQPLMQRRAASRSRRHRSTQSTQSLR